MKKNMNYDEEEFIKKYSSMCKRCNRNFLLEYEYEFVCYICGFNIEKTKNQLTKIQKKKNTNFLNRLTYAKPKIIAICMEVNLLINKITFPNNINEYDILGAILTYLKQKKLKIIDSILENFDYMPDDFETNGIDRNSKGIWKAGNYSIRMMSWLVRDIYVNNINYYDLIGTALTYMKGRNLYVSKEVFALINEIIFQLMIMK